MRHLPFIKSDTIRHSDQVYDTAGNYGNEGSAWWFEISKMKDWRYEAMVLVHEICERILCEDRKIKLKDIDFFDMHGEGKDHPDPGTLKSAPYFREHKFATKVEKMLCKEFGLDWNVYDKSFEKLVYKRVDKTVK